jgi:hypothetical protein
VNLQRVKERLQNGFRPFELQLSNGRKVPVPHPEFIIVGQGTVVVMGESDAVSIIDALHIVSLDDTPAGRA